ncbi:PAS domain-containing sensor histidine kinase [Phormidesmis priestleyi]
MSSADYLQALRECCRDDAAFTRLRQLLVSMPGDLNAFSFLPQPESLQASQIRNQALLNMIPDTLFRIRRDGTYLDVNAGRETELAISPEKLLGRRLQDLLPTHLADQRLYYLERALQTREMQCYEYQIWVKGELRDREARIVVCGEDEVLAIMRDITQRKQAEAALRESEEKFSTAFRCSPSAMVLATFEEGRFFEVNDSFCRMLGYSRQEILGQTTLDLGVWSNLEERALTRQHLEQKGFIRDVELKFRRKSGEQGKVLFSAEMIQVSGKPCALCVMNDITEIAKLYQQVQSLNANLEIQVADRTAELQQKMAELQELSQLKEDFLHAVSHDLRTPIVGMGLVLKNLLKRRLGSGEAAVQVARSILERMMQSCDRQLNLINSLLEAHSSEVKGVVLRCEAVQLNSLVQTVLAELEPLASENRATLVSIVSDALPPVMGDAVQIQRVFENLLTNALQHNSPGLTVTVRLTIVQNSIRCEIRDDGVGMTLEECDHLFDRYVRGRRERRSAGIGLGLFLCRQIITVHGGQIGVESTPGNGATFWFTLPFA